MKIKNFKMFFAGALALAVIFTFRECRDYKLKQSKSADKVKFEVEEINFEGVFLPVDKMSDVNLKPEIKEFKGK